MRTNDNTISKATERSKCYHGLLLRPRPLFYTFGAMPVRGLRAETKLLGSMFIPSYFNQSFWCILYPITFHQSNWIPGYCLVRWWRNYRMVRPSRRTWYRAEIWGPRGMGGCDQPSKLVVWKRFPEKVRWDWLSRSWLAKKNGESRQKLAISVFYDLLRH